MEKIVVTALILGAVAGLADGMFASDGPLFTAVSGVIASVVTKITGFSFALPGLFFQ